jgi:outer membrane receptor protein involved in Fe transport
VQEFALAEKVIKNHMNMNKKLISIAAGVLSAGILSADGGCGLSALSLDATIGFDSEYVYRGHKLDQQVIAPGIKVGASLFDQGELYFGNKNFLSTNSSDYNKHDFSIGFSHELTEIFTVDVGFTHHVWKNLRKAVDKKSGWDGIAKKIGVKKHGNEIYMGFVTDVLLSPSLYYNYDFTWKRHNLEGGVDYLYDLSSFGINGFAVDISVKLGFDRTQKPFGMKKDIATDLLKAFDTKKSYWYYGTGADLVYTFNENVKIRTGVKFEGLNKKKAWVYRGHKNLCWFSASFDCSC